MGVLTRRRDTPGLNQLSTMDYGRGSPLVIIMVVVMVMVVRISTMNFFQVFKLEVTHGCLQCVSGDAHVGLKTATSESTQDRGASPQMGAPSWLCCRRRNGRSKTKPEPFLLLPGKEHVLQGKEQAEPSQPGKSPSGM